MSFLAHINPKYRSCYVQIGAWFQHSEYSIARMEKGDETSQQSAIFWGRFFRGVWVKLSIIKKRNCIECLKRGSSSEWMVMCFLTSDTKKSSETTLGTVKRTRIVVRAWFNFNLEIISRLLFAPTPYCGQRLAGAVGEPFIPVEEKSRRVRFHVWPPKETTWLIFRCYQVGKWVKKTILENVFLVLGFSS